MKSYPLAFMHIEVKMRLILLIFNTKFLLSGPNMYEAGFLLNLNIFINYQKKDEYPETISVAKIISPSI